MPYGANRPDCFKVDQGTMSRRQRSVQVRPKWLDVSVDRRTRPLGKLHVQSRAKCTTVNLSLIIQPMRCGSDEIMAKSYWNSPQ